MTRLVACELHPLRLPMRLAVRHAAAERAHTDSLLVHVRSGRAEGWGEGTPREHVHGLPDGTDRDALRVRLDALVGHRAPRTLEEVEALVDGLPAAARCALELALLDELARREGTGVVTMLGEPLRTEVRYSAVVPLLPEDLEILALARIRTLGLVDVKVKLAGDATDAARLARVRGALGDRPIRVDLNGALTPSEAPRLAAILEQQGVTVIEEPGPPGDLDTLAAIRAALRPGQQVLLDDSIRTPEDFEAAWERGLCDRALLKVSKHGGLLPTLRLAWRARDLGVPCHLGCHVGETSLLSAAGRIAAAHFPFETVEGSYGPLLLERDVCARPLGFGLGGHAQVDVRGPGLGIDVVWP